MENTDINNIELTIEDEIAMCEAYWYGTPWYEIEMARIQAKMEAQNGK